MANFELIKSAFSRQLGRSVKVMVEFSHSKFTETFRIIDNTEAVTVSGDTFNPYPFKFIANAQGQTQGGSIVLSNVDRNIAGEIRSATDNETIVATVWIAHLESDGTTINVERVSAGVFEVFSPVITKQSITLTLNLRVSLDYNMGTIRYNPNLFPNLYL